jgi:hypothetical protein
MHSANFTALSRALSFVSARLLVVPVPVLVAPLLLVLPAVPVLLAVPLSDDAFEPQAALIRPIRPARPRATNGRSFLVMLAPYV